MSDERALLMAIPLRHLESAAERRRPSAVVLPAGGPGDLDAAAAGMPVIVMATDAGDAEVPPRPGAPPSCGACPTSRGRPGPTGSRHLDRRSTPSRRLRRPPTRDGRSDERRRSGRADDDDDVDDDDDDEGVGPQSFLEVTDLQPLPRERVAVRQRAGRQAGARRPVVPAAGPDARRPARLSRVGSVDERLDLEVLAEAEAAPSRVRARTACSPRTASSPIPSAPLMLTPPARIRRRDPVGALAALADQTPAHSP